MKYTLLFFILLLSEACFAQRSEISLSRSYGIAKRNYEPDFAGQFTRRDYENAKIISESATNVRYAFTIFNKRKNNFRVGTGLSLTNSVYSQNIIDKKYGYLLDHVEFKNKQINIPLFIGLERGFYDNKLFLEFQFGFNADIPLKNQATYKGGENKKYDFIDYDYTLNAKFIGAISHTFVLNSKFNIYKNLFFNFSISLLKTRYVSYNYNINTTYYLTNVSTGTTTTEYWHIYSLENIRLYDNYFYFTAGFSVKLGKKTL